MPDTTLVVCSEASERHAYSGWLRTEGYQVVEAASAGDAVEHHRHQSLPLTVADMAVPSMDGSDLFRSIRAINPDAELLLLSTSATVRSAIAAMKAGAADCLLKPVTRETLLASIRKLGVLDEVLQENRRLREELHQKYDLSHIIALSPQMLRLLSLAGRVAATNTTALITGESGTGKELLARAIHINSTRAHRPMVSINCAAIPETLFESEIFGYHRGAFTGAHGDKPGLLTTADGGTFFFDEIADLPFATQAKLLRFLHEGTYFPLGSTSPRSANVRVIAATNANLLQRTLSGHFRKDLYYRLSVFPMHIPPLRTRPQDIMPLAHHFLRQIGDRVGKHVPGFSREVVSYLMTRPWTGNVRELQNAVERAVIVSAGNLLTSADFRTLDATADSAQQEADAVWLLPENGIDLPELNRRLITQALARANYNVSVAARMLSVSRPTLRSRLRRLGLERPLDPSPQISKRGNRRSV